MNIETLFRNCHLALPLEIPSKRSHLTLGVGAGNAYFRNDRESAIGGREINRIFSIVPPPLLVRALATLATLAAA